jgi:hypothetical protein
MSRVNVSGLASFVELINVVIRSLLANAVQNSYSIQVRIQICVNITKATSNARILCIWLDKIKN